MELDIKRWQSLTLAQQMGNIGSEVQRAFSMQKRGEEEQKEKSIDRFLEMIDCSLADKRWQKRCLEICRLREVLCDYFFAKNSFGNSFENLINYFNGFALKTS
ncbi:MAG: hypothetical protein V1819_00300 [bacterium]